VGGGFDVVVCADVFEHVRHPDKLLLEIAERLAPGGSVVASIPNFAHWYPRLRVGLGRFDYDARGILDKGHLRFFTKRSFTDLVRRAGWGVRRSEALGLPLEVVDRGGAGGQPSKLRDKGRRLDQLAVAVRPNLFAYQYLFELEPTST
jgi:SAM-dependent methyltransferase